MQVWSELATETAETFFPQNGDKSSVLCGCGNKNVEIIFILSFYMTPHVFISCCCSCIG